MSNPLDPIREAYETLRDALKVVRRCATLPAIDEDRPFRNTGFHQVAAAACETRVDEAESELDDLTVLSFYAAFEARLRDHVAQQSTLLTGATHPDAEFGQALASTVRGYTEEARMARLTGLFAHAAGQPVVAQVGNIRAFRNWVAHGKTSSPPPSVPPLFAYEILTQFLRSASLI